MNVSEAKQQYEAAAAKFYKADEAFVNARYRRAAAVRECEIALRDLEQARKGDSALSGPSGLEVAR